MCVNLLGIVKRRFRVGQYERGRKQGLAVLCEQGVYDPVIRDPQTNALARWVADSPGDFLAGIQNKREGAGRREL